MRLVSYSESPRRFCAPPFRDASQKTGRPRPWRPWRRKLSTILSNFADHMGCARPRALAGPSQHYALHCIVSGEGRGESLALVYPREWPFFFENCTKPAESPLQNGRLNTPYTRSSRYNPLLITPCRPLRWSDPPHLCVGRSIVVPPCQGRVPSNLTRSLECLLAIWPTVKNRLCVCSKTGYMSARHLARSENRRLNTHIDTTTYFMLIIETLCVLLLWMEVF
jgi:hypothetical protein